MRILLKVAILLILASIISFSLFILNISCGRVVTQNTRKRTIGPSFWGVFPASHTILFVGSITCIQPTIAAGKCRRSVESIRTQVHHVFVYVSESYGRIGDHDLPMLDGLRHQNTTLILGPNVGKYVGSLHHIREMAVGCSNVWIFTCSDSHIYHADLIYSMISGKNMSKPSFYQNMFDYIEQTSNCSGMVNGAVGNLAHVQLLDDLLKYPVIDQAAIADDQWMSTYLHKKGVYVVESGVNNFSHVFAEGGQEEEFQHRHTGNKNMNALRELEIFYGVQFKGTRVSHTLSDHWPIPSKTPAWNCSHDSDWHTRSCWASHVCLDKPRNYNEEMCMSYNEEKRYTIIDTNSLLPAQAPPLSAGLGRCDHTDKRHSLEIDLRQGATLPANARWEAGVYIFLRRYCPGNFGHFLLDVVLPAFVSYFSMYPEGKNPGIVVDDLCSSGATLFEYSQSNCEHISNRLLPFLSDKIIYVRKYPSIAFCFEEMVSSNCRYGMYSVHGGIWAIPAVFFKRFQAYVWQRASRSAAVTKQTPTILVTFKKPGQRRRVLNMPEVSAWLQTEFGADAMVRFEDLGDMPLTESVELMSRVFLFVTPGGGISIATVFLPGRSTVILGTFCGRCDASSCRNNDVDVLFRHLHKIDVQTFEYHPRQQDMAVSFKKSLWGCDYRMGNREWLALMARIAFKRRYF